MKLQTKFILVLLGAMLAIVTGIQVFQGVLIRTTLKSYASDNLKRLHERERVHADNIHQTIQPVVETTIAMGEMPKLESLIASYRNIDGIQEYSIYDQKGVAAYSTSSEILKSKKTLPADLKNQLLTSREKFSRDTSNDFEIFQPMVVTAKCVECHDGFKEGDIGGVAVLRLSKETLREAEQKASGAVKKIEEADFTVAVLATLVISVALIVLTYWTVKRLITKPLTTIINRLEVGAEQVNASSAEIAAASQTLATDASEQASSLEETSSSLEIMSARTVTNAENSRRVNACARQTREAAERGSVDVKEMGMAMEAAKASSTDIAKIIKTIDEIAFQTNILALNASVEAARAGEAGLGFAVVADEVRSLAQRCAEAAHETTAMIEGAIKNTKNGVEISAKVARVLTDIVEHARAVDGLASEVASACNEESRDINQINVAVEEIDKVTLENAARAEESARAAEELNSQAELMRASVVELLRLLGGRELPRQRNERAKPTLFVPRNDAPKPPSALATKQVNRPKRTKELVVSR